MSSKIKTYYNQDINTKNLETNMIYKRYKKAKIFRRFTSRNRRKN